MIIDHIDQVVDAGESERAGFFEFFHGFFFVVNLKTINKYKPKMEIVKGFCKKKMNFFSCLKVNISESPIAREPSVYAGWRAAGSKCRARPVIERAGG